MLSLTRMTAVVLALVAWLWSTVVFIGSLFIGAGLRCDEACTGEGWRRSRDGWQWDVVVGLGALPLLAATALVVFVWRTKPAWAAASVALGLGAVFVLAAMLSPEWVEHLDRHEREDYLLYTIGPGAAVLAVLLSGVKSRQPREAPRPRE